MERQQQTTPEGVSVSTETIEARIAETRSRLVYVANQAAHCDGETHKAVREFVYAADALAARLSGLQEERDEWMRGFDKATDAIKQLQTQLEAVTAREARALEALDMLWTHYLLPLSDEQKAEVLAVLSAVPTTKGEAE